MEGKRIAREGAIVKTAGKDVGVVTSGTFSPTLNQTIAMAYVDADLQKPGTPCQVDVRGKEEAAQVVALPFYRRPRPTGVEEFEVSPTTLRGEDVS